MMKIGIVVGTRPEIIKMAPVIRECIKRDISYFIIHSNQHYSSAMDSIFFDELKLPKPDYNLGVGSGLHSNQTGNILIKMEPILLAEKPDVVLVQGDTNTVLAGALAASKLNIKVGHIEAGLRSYDRTMPEETNRIMTDHISEYLFAVGANQEKILHGEGIAPQKNSYCWQHRFRLTISAFRDISSTKQYIIRIRINLRQLLFSDGASCIQRRYFRKFTRVTTFIR
jgi:UDP-N-acetylglucosamine 2-epimerase (non-hydrolysing)